LAVASEPNVVEGDPVLTSPVLIEFPDLGAARTWYNSPEYQPLKELRHGREACGVPEVVSRSLTSGDRWSDMILVCRRGCFT
jgi:hypothetical protein